MKLSAYKDTEKTKIWLCLGTILVLVLFFLSLFVGKFPLSLNGIISGNDMQRRVFVNLRLSRALVGVCGGFVLGVAGYVYQIVFRNPLASPDIIGVSSGASAGAAAGILFFNSALSVNISSFIGALLAVILAMFFSSFDKAGRKSTVVLAGIAVHSLAQTILMCLKLMADPEKELASIEYWIMGSLNGINLYDAGINIAIALAAVCLLMPLHRHTILLSADEAEAKLLGLDVNKHRILVLCIATIGVSSVVSIAGLISFVGLLAPHIAKRINKINSKNTMIFSGIVGAIILTGSDILAKSVAATELPVSIFTSLIGAPFLIFLIARGRERV